MESEALTKTNLIVLIKGCILFSVIKRTNKIFAKEKLRFSLARAFEKKEFSFSRFG